MATLIQAGTVEAQSTHTSSASSIAFSGDLCGLSFSRTSFMPDVITDPLSHPLPGNAAAPARSFQPAPRPAPALPTEPALRRSLSPIAGKSLEKLGHAIEYLADDFAFEAAVNHTAISGAPLLQAIQILKSLNRQVYFECPIVEPLAQRVFNWLFPQQGKTALQ